jgi:hypothetical protein
MRRRDFSPCCNVSCGPDARLLRASPTFAKMVKLQAVETSCRFARPQAGPERKLFSAIEAYRTADQALARAARYEGKLSCGRLIGCTAVVLMKIIFTMIITVKNYCTSPGSMLNCAECGGTPSLAPCRIYFVT